MSKDVVREAFCDKSAVSFLINAEDNFHGFILHELRKASKIVGLRDLLVPKTVHVVIIDHSDRLHERVADCRADEFEAAV